MDAPLQILRGYEWISKMFHVYYMGLKDIALKDFGPIVAAKLPKAGDIFLKGELMAYLVSDRKCIGLYAPYDLEIVEINQVLKISPEMLLEDPMHIGILSFEKI